MTYRRGGGRRTSAAPPCPDVRGVCARRCVCATSVDQVRKCSSTCPRGLNRSDARQSIDIIDNGIRQQPEISVWGSLRLPNDGAKPPGNLPHLFECLFVGHSAYFPAMKLK